MNRAHPSLVVSLLLSLVASACSSRGDAPPAAPPSFDDAGVTSPPPRGPAPRCPGRTDPDDFSPCDGGTRMPPDDPPPPMPDAGPPPEPDAGPTPAPPVCPFPTGGCDVACAVPARAADPCDAVEVTTGRVITTDTVWSGTLCVDGTVGVLNGATLTVAAGAEVYFLRGGVSVEGHLAIEGRPGDEVLFSAAGLEPTAGSWMGIEVQLSEGGTIDANHAIIEYASSALQTWEYHSDPTFAGGEPTVVAHHSLFRYNAIAIVPDDNTEIRYSTIVCNDGGIHVASEDEPLQVIGDNNICFNRRQGMLAQQDGADARNNYWCTTDAAEVGRQIRDERTEIHLGGLIDYEPFRTSPVPEAPPVP